eukprot:1156911-Pelagomonas_calceolata.AAC.8
MKQQKRREAQLTSFARALAEPVSTFPPMSIATKRVVKKGIQRMFNSMTHAIITRYSARVQLNDTRNGNKAFCTCS